MLKTYKSQNVFESFDQYHFIGKMEILIEISPYIMKKLGINKEDLFPAEGGSSCSIETKNLVVEQFSKVTLEVFYQIYQSNFEAFGFKLLDIVTKIMEF